MNRKQRRAATKLGPPASANSSDSGERIRQPDADYGGSLAKA